MSDYSAHTIHAKYQHLGWNRDQPPIRTVTSGQILEFETIDASGGQIGPDSSEKAITGIDPFRVNPLTGPVFIDGAEPGDALVVEVLDFAPSGWGWTAIGSNLMQAARDAVRNMIDLLTSGSNLGSEEAYMLCSVCGDLRISEIVDAPNWVIAFYFPRCVLD